MVAQLLYNSAGQLVLSSAFLLGYLLFSAVCSTVAFALFEVSTIFQLHDLHTLDASIKSEIGAEKLIRRGYLVLVVSSLINFLSVLYFLALAWHSTSGSAATFPLDNLPSPWNWLYYAVHALAYTLVLFLAGIYGERPRSAKEVVLATQRALEQRALELWRLQTEAKIEGMMRRGEPLGAVAAALASHETAERIAVLEAATSGGLTRCRQRASMSDALAAMYSSSTTCTRMVRRSLPLMVRSVKIALLLTRASRTRASLSRHR
jgi:hypothetical protein